MKAWAVIGLLFAAAIFATIPISPQVTPRGLELGVDGAKAVTYGHYRRVHRRVYRRHYRYARRAYRRAYYWGAPSTTTVLPPTMGGGTGTIELAQRLLRRAIMTTSGATCALTGSHGRATTTPGLPTSVELTGW